MQIIEITLKTALFPERTINKEPTNKVPLNKYEGCKLKILDESF